MNDRGGDEEEEQRHMQKVPKAEETFVEPESRGLLDGGDMQRDEFGHGSEPAPLKPARLTEPPTLDGDRLPRIGDQPPAHKSPAPAQHWPEEEPSHNALGRGGGEPHKS